MTGGQIGLIGCVKTKLAHRAPARDLYISPLFRGRRAWVERTCERWFILSGKHGLVDPASHLAPYDFDLSRISRPARRAWSEHVLVALRDCVGSLKGHAFEAHAGINYLEYGLRAGLVRAGATVVVPMQGLLRPQQLAKYRDATRDAAHLPRHG